MAYRVTQATWLASECERVRQILLMPRHRGRKLTLTDMREVLRAVGLHYSLQEMSLLLAELVRQGVAGDVS